MKWALAVVCACLALAHPAAAEGDGTAKISRFSGKAVPRFESLRYASVNGRAGPSTEHPVLWHYERKGLPLMIIKESGEWRKVRDPEGEEVWMHARMLARPETLYVVSEAQVHRSADLSSAVIARLGAGALVEAGACTDVACEVRIGRQKGWAPRLHFWGADRLSAPAK
jgi:SH3-like domain-containing protein